MTSAKRSRLNKAIKLTLLGGVLAFAAALPAPAAQGPVEVDLKLVLATDVSGSINDQEHRLQREGTADAFLDPDVIKAIKEGALGRIAVAMLDFSSPEFDKIIINWRIVDDEASATAFAETIRDTPRTPGRRTSVSSALELGALLIEQSEGEIVATRRVIDVSGDGPNNDGKRMTPVHDRVIEAGIVVNGLPVMDDNANGYFPNLDRYYQACVAGGRGAFVIVAHSFKDFGTAMRHKLILEISQNETQIQRAGNDPAHPLLTRIAAVPLRAPLVLRPEKNGFSENCDIAGGFGFGGFPFR